MVDAYRPSSNVPPGMLSLEVRSSSDMVSSSGGERKLYALMLTDGCIIGVSLNTVYADIWSTGGFLSFISSGMPQHRSSPVRVHGRVPIGGADVLGNVTITFWARCLVSASASRCTSCSRRLALRKDMVRPSCPLSPYGNQASSCTRQLHCRTCSCS